MYVCVCACVMYRWHFRFSNKFVCWCVSMPMCIISAITQNITNLGNVTQWTLSDQGQGHFRIFQLPQYKLSSPLSELWHLVGSCD